MSTTPAGAFAALRARAEAQITTLPLYWQDEDNDGALPDTPAAFVYFEWTVERAELAAFGGGRGANLYRNAGELAAYVFVPIGWGLAEGLTRGETVAAAFRSYRTAEISCFGASVEPAGRGADLIPPAVESAAGNYSVVVVIVDVSFDLIG